MSDILHSSTSRPARAPSTRTRARAARVAIAAILVYQALSWAAAALHPGWNPLTRQISDYSLGDHGWLMIAAFVASGIAYAALAVALSPRVRDTGRRARVGVAILAYCALGSVGVGVFVTDPDTTAVADISAHGLLHVVFGLSALLLLPLAAYLVTVALAHAHQLGSPARRPLRVVAFLPLACLIGVWVPEMAGLIPAGGWPDRVLFGTYTIWVLVVAWSLRATDRRDVVEDPEMP